jgi:hypothetical protein
VKELDDVLGEARLVKGRNDLFGNRRCLRRRLDDYTVAREKSGNDGVDKSKIWVLKVNS